MKTILKIVIYLLLFVVVISLLISFITKKLGFNLDWLFNRESIEQVSLDNDIGGQTNGGLTSDEVDKFSNDDKLPFSDDVFRNFIIRETDKYVVIFRESTNLYGESIYPNLSFVKTPKGLIWDGVWGITAEIQTNFWNARHDFNNAKFNLNFKLVSFRGYDASSLANLAYNGILQGLVSGGNDESNIVTFSDFRADFCPGYYKYNILSNLWADAENELNRLFNLTHSYIVKNVFSPFFQNITDVENGPVEMRAQNNNSANLEYMNSFATYLWFNSKSLDREKNTKVLDISSYFNKYIKDEDKPLYPISASKLEEYPGHEFYPIYNCKIVANVEYSYDFVQIHRDNKKIETKTKDIKVSEVPKVEEALSELRVKLNNKDASDLSSFNIENAPVEIKIGDKLLKFTTEKDLINGKLTAIKKGSLTNFDIESNELLFDSYSGTLLVNDTISTKTFDFTYLENSINLSVSLNQISSLGRDTINLKSNPVRIILTGKNGEGTHQFVFNDNSMLDEKIIKTLKKGSYEYAVLSEQLIFSSTSGNIEITSTSRNQIFNYTVILREDDLKFNIDVSSTRGTGQDLNVSASKNTVDLLSSKLEDNAFKVELKIFNSEGYMFVKQIHTHSPGNTCSDGWSSNNALSQGTEYTGQLIYRSANSDKSYVSGIFTFVFAKGMIYTFTYSCIEV